MGYLGVLLALMIQWRAFEKADGQVKEQNRGSKCNFGGKAYATGDCKQG